MSNEEPKRETKVILLPETVISRNEPSNFAFIIPALPNGKYYGCRIRPYTTPIYVHIRHPYTLAYAPRINK